MKKIISILTFFLFVIILSAQTFEIDMIIYKKTSLNTVMVIAKTECDTYTDFIIPNNVTYKDSIYKVTAIEDNAFENCKNLTKIIVEKNNPNYLSIDGLLYDKNAKILLRCPRNCDMSNITLPKTLTTIGNSAFMRCDNIQK